jgi:hypothetical protein
MTTGTGHIQFSTFPLAGVDIDLEHRLANFLYQQHVPDTDSIRLVARGGVVVVSGELSSRHAKWLCIECCRRVAGVIRIVDELTVAPAIAQFPEAVRIKDELKNYSPVQRHNIADSVGQSKRISKPATREMVAASPQQRLPAAA